MATRIDGGNLPYAADGYQLLQLLSAFGEVVQATILMDRDASQSKGFGFVQMPSDDAAHRAIAGLNGSALCDRAITVNEVTPRARAGWRSRGARLPVCHQ